MQRIETPEADAVRSAVVAFLESLEPDHGESEVSFVDQKCNDLINEAMLPFLLKLTGNNQSHAAIIMGRNRATLRERLKRHNMIPERFSFPKTPATKKD